MVSLIPFAAAAFAADLREGEILRGKLLIRDGKGAFQTAGNKTVQLDGDEPTLKVLGDKRLDGFEAQAKGRYTGAGQFTIDPIHTNALMVNDHGKYKLVTYWCEVCSIRSYTPGPCACCQRYTDLDLRDPDHVDNK
jgi:hypothetical protein